MQGKFHGTQSYHASNTNMQVRNSYHLLLVIYYSLLTLNRTRKMFYYLNPLGPCMNQSMVVFAALKLLYENSEAFTYSIL